MEREEVMVYHNYMLKMGYKKQIILTVIISLLGIGIVSYPNLVNELLEDIIGFPALSVFLSLLPLYFLKEGVFKAWRTFALIYLPIAIFLIAISPEQLDQSFLGMSYGSDRESTSIATAGLFVLVSYLIIAYKSFTLRSK